MKSRLWIGAGIVAVTGLLSLLQGIQPAPRPSAGAPGKGRIPLSVREERDAESRGRTDFEAWEESRHHAPPGVDWRAIEARNQRANMARRAALRQRRAKPPADSDHWRERGGINQTGRTQVTALSADGRSLLVGTAGGGIFSGKPGAPSWQPHGDNLGISVYHLLVAPGRPEVWLAADLYQQIFVSRDQGASWSVPRGLPDLTWIYQVRRDGADPRTVYLLARPADRADGQTLFRSGDGGLSFSPVYAGAESGSPDLWTSRTASGPLYLMTGGRLLVSTDRGASFSPLGTAGAGDAPEVVLRGSEAGAPTLYAALSDRNGGWRLWVSEDGGSHWEARYDFANVFFAGSLGSMNASIHDPQRILFGGTNAYRSADGGHTFTLINDWPDYYDNPRQKLHADIDGIDVVSWQGRETFFLNTDGGTFLSTDGGETVENIALSGLPNAMYYSTVSRRDNPDWIAAGAQDQGFQLSHPGSGSLAFDQILIGDYGNLTSSSGDLQMLYFAYPGFLSLLPDPARPDDIRTIRLPALSRGSFFPCIAADPDDPQTLYLAGDHLWRLHQGDGDTFTQTKIPQDFSSADGKDSVAGLAVSPADHDRWYAATAEGYFWSSRDRGATWSLSAATTAHSQYFYAAFVLASPTDPDTAFAAGNGYGYTGPVWRTIDGGRTWEPISDGLPQTLVSALAFDNPQAQNLYAASDAGPFRLDLATGTWSSILGGEAPLTAYRGVESLPGAGILRFATFGRGIWDFTPPSQPGRHLRPIFLP